MKRLTHDEIEALRPERLSTIGEARGFNVGFETCQERNLAEIACLKAENERLTAEDMCDACAGTGKPAPGVPCMCGGTGKMSDAARWLRGENAKAMAKLAGATFNCPSCGRHDFGLWQGAAQLKDEVDRLTAEVERLTVSGKEELARLHSHDPARVERAAEAIFITKYKLEGADEPDRAWRSDAPWDTDAGALCEWERDEYRQAARAAIAAADNKEG